MTIERRAHLSIVDSDQTETIFTNGCDFVICEHCNWTATVFKTRHSLNILERCPLCSETSHLSFIPIATNEAYNFTIHDRRGLEIEFANRTEVPL